MNLETKIKRPSLSTMSFEELEEAHKIERKADLQKVNRHYIRSGLKKAVAITLIAFGAMYYGAKFSKEVSQIEETITNYLFNNENKIDYPKIVYQRGRQKW